MSSTPNYHQWSPEALRDRQKALKKKEIIAAFMIGFLVSIIIYAVAKDNTSIVAIVIPLLLMAGVFKHAKSTKAELQEIKAVIDKQSSQ